MHAPCVCVRVKFWCLRILCKFLHTDKQMHTDTHIYTNAQSQPHSQPRSRPSTMFVCVFKHTVFVCVFGARCTENIHVLNWMHMRVSLDACRYVRHISTYVCEVCTHSCTHVCLFHIHMCVQIYAPEPSWRHLHYPCHVTGHASRGMGEYGRQVQLRSMQSMGVRFS